MKEHMKNVAAFLVLPFIPSVPLPHSRTPEKLAPTHYGTECRWGSFQSAHWDLTMSKMSKMTDPSKTASPKIKIPINAYRENGIIYVTADINGYNSLLSSEKPPLVSIGHLIAMQVKNAEKNCAGKPGQAQENSGSTIKITFQAKPPTSEPQPK